MCSSGQSQPAEQSWILLLFSVEVKRCYRYKTLLRKIRKKNKNQDYEKRASENYFSICFLTPPVDTEISSFNN